MVDIVRETYAANKQVCFDGDNYDEAWHAEAEQRGLANLRTTPDALPWLVEKQTIATFERYKVLSERELESRFEVMVEQYTTRAEHRGRDGRLDRPHDAAARPRSATWPTSRRPATRRSWPRPQELVGEFYDAILALEKANEDHPAEEGLELAKYMRDTVVPGDGRARARSPTAWSASWPTTCGRCRSTRRCSSSSSAKAACLQALHVTGVRTWYVGSPGLSQLGPARR